MPKLIPNWRQAWRMFSVQAQASSVAILGAWQALPDDLRGKVPEPVVLGIVGALLVFILTLMGKIDGTAYTMTTIGIVGAYITGNTAQKIKAPGAEGNA